MGYNNIIVCYKLLYFVFVQLFGFQSLFNMDGHFTISTFKFLID